MSRSGWEALPNVREWSGGSKESPGVVLIPSRMSGKSYRMPGRISRMSESGRESLPYVREKSEGPLVGPGVVGRPCQMSESDQKALLDVWEWS